MKHNISAYLIKQYKWQEAEKLLLEALSIFTEVYGESHNNTISSQYNLAQLYEKMLLFDKAINKWNIIIGIYKSKNNSEQVAKFHSLLALTLNQAGRHEEALEHNLLSIEISKDLVSNQINFNAQLLSRYARTLIASESLNEAKTILIQSLELLEKDNEKNNYERLFVLNILADVHFKLKNNIKAIETYKEILNHDDKENKLNQKEQIKALLGSGMVMLDSKQYFEAEQYFQDALTLNQTLADENYTESIILYQMGKLKKALDLTKEAQSLFNQAMNIQSKIVPENHPDLILTKNMIDTINNY